MKLVAPVTFLTQQPKPAAPRDAGSLPVSVVELDALGNELLASLGNAPQPYRLNAAIFNFGLRFHQLYPATPKRDRGKLVSVYVRHGQELYQRWLRLSRVELSKPPKPETGLPPEPEPPRQPTTFDVLSELYQSI